MNNYRLVIDGHAVAVIKPADWRCVRRLAHQVADALGQVVRIELAEIELATVAPAAGAVATQG